MIEPLALPEVADEPPAGPDLEYDPDFLAMKQAAAGSAESQFGDTVEGAVAADWKEVTNKAMDLLGRSRDLRVLVMLAAAHVNMKNLPGFASTLMTIRQQIETTWAEVHPLLDPEEPEDTQVRSNALLDLKDARRMLRPLREVPLAVPPRGQSPVTWRDIAVASGAMEAEPGREKMSAAEIRGGFAATEPARLLAVGEALDVIAAELAAIPRAFDAHAGVGQGPDFDPLPKLVRDMRMEVTRYQDTSGEGAAEDTAGGEEGGEEGETEERAPRAARGGGRSFTSLRSITALESREDALHALTLASSYFRLNEPSSPLPLLIDRAARLSSMPFMDILRDLAPDGLLQAQTVAGAPAEE